MSKNKFAGNKNAGTYIKNPNTVICVCYNLQRINLFTCTYC